MDGDVCTEGGTYQMWRSGVSRVQFRANFIHSLDEVGCIVSFLMPPMLTTLS